MNEPLLRPANLLDDERDLELLTLDVLLLSKYGFRYIDWDSDALKQELIEDFGSVGVVTWERIQACRLLHASDIFWKEWEVFEKITAAIMGEPPIFSFVQPPESEEVAVALDTASKISSNEYSEEVKRYIAAACLHDGLWYLEDPLTVAHGEILAHDRWKEIDRDFGSVATRLRTQTKYNMSPETMADVQANNVISVRNALQVQRRSVKTQMKDIASILEESHVYRYR